MPSDEAILANLIKHIKNAEDDPFTPLLDSYMLRRDASPNRHRTFTVPLVERTRPGGRLSPSNLCGCERQAAFVFLGVKGQRKLSTEQQLLFDDGNWRHHKWGAIFLDMQAVLGPKKFKVRGLEKPIYIPSLKIAGHLDADIAINGIPYIVDFKGINMWGFDKVFRAQQPLASHVLQLIAYMRGKKVRRGLILYDDKNTSRPKVFQIKFTKQKWAEVSEWCESVLSKIEAKKLPPKTPDCHSGNFLYERCPFAKLCYGKLEKDEVRQLAYRDFIGLEDSWKKGLEVAKTQT